MTKCLRCVNGKELKEGLDFLGTYAIITYDLVDCSWCGGTGSTTGD